METGMNLEEAERLRQELERLNEQLQAMSRVADPGGFDRLVRKLAEAERALAQLNVVAARTERESRSVAVSVGKAADGFAELGSNGGRAGDELASGIAVQRDALQELEAVYAGVAEAAGALGDGVAKTGIQGELAAIRQMIDEETRALNEQQQVQEGYGAKLMSLSGQMAGVRGQMELLVSAGKLNSEEYRRLQGELSGLQGAYREVEQRQAALASGKSVLSGMVAGVQGLSSALSAGQSVLSVFVGDNERLAAIQARLQGVMSVLVNVQQVSNVLHAAGALRVGVLSRVTGVLTGAQAGLSAALGISTVAAGALMATLTLGLSVAITGLSLLIDRWAGQQKKAAKEQEELINVQKRAADGAGQQKLAYGQLQQQWNELGDDLEAKRRFIDENRGGFEKLGVSVAGVQDAENLLVKNSQSFIQALEQRAKAMAAGEVAAERYKEAMSKRIEADALKEAHTTVRVRKGDGVTYRSVEWDDAESARRYHQLVKEANEAESLAGVYLKKQSEAMKGASESLKKVNPDKYVKRSVGEQVSGLKRELAEAERELTAARGVDSVKSVEEIQQAEKRVKELKDRLEVFDGGREAEARKAAELEKEIGRMVLDGQLRVEAERIALMKQGKEKRLEESKADYEAQKRELDKWYADLESKRREQGKQPTIGETQLYEERSKGNEEAWKRRDSGIEAEYAKENRARMQELTDVFLSDEMKKLAAVRKRYEDEQVWAKERLDGGSMSREAYDSFMAQAERVKKQEEYRVLLGDLKDFQQEEERLRTSWDARIAEAAGNPELEAKLQQGKRKAVQELNGRMLTESADWIRLFENLDTLTVKELDSLIGNIQGKLNSGELDLGSGGLESALGKLSGAREKLSEESPFKGLASSAAQMKKALADLRKAEESGLTGAALDEYKQKVVAAGGDVKKAIGKVGEAYGKVSGVMKDAAGFVGMLDEGLGETVGNAIALGDAVMNVGSVVGDAVKSFAVGMSTMEAASVVLLVIQAMLTAVTAAIGFFNGDKKREKRIQEYADEVKSLERAYNSLGKAIDKSYSSEKVALIDEQEENLKQQQELLQKQIEEERAKKKTDDGKVTEWQNKVADLNDEIAEMKERRIEAIMGKDVQAALDDFAQAYADAWASGEDRAKAIKDVVRDLIKGAVIEMIKLKMNPEVQKLMQFLSTAVADGISATEQAQIDRMSEGIYRTAEATVKGYEQFLRDGKEDAEPKNGVTGELQAAMTEGTASQVLGAINMMNMRTADILQVNLEHREVSRAGFVDVCGVLRESFEVQKRIEVNTASTVAGLKEGFDRLDSRLGSIESNTKGYNGRG